MRRYAYWFPKTIVCDECISPPLNVYLLWNIMLTYVIFAQLVFYYLIHKSIKNEKCIYTRKSHIV